MKKGSDDLLRIFRLSEFDLLHYRADRVRERVGRELEGFAVVVDAHHVAEPSGLNQRNELKIRHIEVLCLVISLDGLAEADGQLLGSIRSDSLRRVRHEGIGNSHLENRVNELFGVENAGVDHDRKSLFVADGPDQADQVFVLHLLGDEVIAQKAAKDGQCRVQRIEAGADLHLLYFVDGLSVGEHEAALFELGPSVREVVLDDQVLGLLRVYERSHIGLHACDHGRELVDSVGVDDLCHGLVGTRGDLVDHGPGEGDLVALDISLKFGLCDAVLHPAFRECRDGSGELVTVVGAVVHADHGDGLLTGFKAGVKE